MSSPGNFQAGAFIAVCQDGEGWEDIFYLSGFFGTSGALVVTPEDSVLFVDSRYIELAGETCACKFMSCATCGQLTPMRAAVAYATGCKPERVAFGGRKLTYSSYRELYSLFGGNIKLVDYSNVLMNMRRRKSYEETVKIREAIDVATRAFAAALAETSEGVTERNFAATLEYMARTGGGDFANLVPVIVSSGVRTSMPHAPPTEKKFERGDLVMADFCVRRGGYVCDITRMFSIGEPSHEICSLYSLVRWAQEEAAALVAPGRAARELDAASREVMEGASLGDYFTHGLGHGIGVSVHEMPSINQFSNALLTEGDVITLEPGFYKPGWGGMRVEDDYLVTKTGAVRLTDTLSRELFVVG
ncbi:MAG: Xaa-Pro peptidase family protein [Synergistaceae bacterium]|nr:Xaa-Pro peptidase family protein [Synergistaceae bacterium]